MPRPRPPSLGTQSHSEPDKLPSDEPRKGVFDDLQRQVDAIYADASRILSADQAEGQPDPAQVLAAIADMRRELDALEFLIRKRGTTGATPAPATKPSHPIAGSGLAVWGRSDGPPQENQAKNAQRTVADHLANIARKREEAGLSPAEAPELWAGREGRRENPVAFIRRVYGRYLGHGLTRAHIRRLDLPLYRALSVWVIRHPDDTLPELPSRSDEVDRMLENLAVDATPDQLRRLGLALQSRKRAGK